jgi:hypothetical protein
MRLRESRPTLSQKYAAGKDLLAGITEDVF